MMINKQTCLVLFLLVFFAESNLRSQEPESQMRIFRLTNASANQLATVVADLAGADKKTRNVRITSDSHSNSLIVSSTDEETLVFISDLIEALDVKAKQPAQADSASYFGSYAFEDDDSLARGFTLLGSMMSGRKDVKMDQDSSGLALYLYGTKGDHDLAKDLFSRIKLTKVANQIENIHISTVLIVDSSQYASSEREGLNLKQPDDRMRKLLESAKRKGLMDIAQPMIASRVTSLIQPSEQTPALQQPTSQAQMPGNRFENESHGTSFILDNHGSLVRLTDERFRLQSTVKISNRTSPQKVAATEFSSNIELPLDYPVLLSCSTIGNIDSVIVVLLSAE